MRIGRGIQREHHVADGKLVEIDHGLPDGRKLYAGRVSTLPTPPHVVLPGNHQHAKALAMALRTRLERRSNKVPRVDSQRLPLICDSLPYRGLRVASFSRPPARHGSFRFHAVAGPWGASYGSRDLFRASLAIATISLSLTRRSHSLRYSASPCSRIASSSRAFLVSRSSSARPGYIDRTTSRSHSRSSTRANIE